MEFGSWKTDLNDALPELRRVALGANEIKILVLNERISFGLPVNRRLAGEIIELYRPMKSRARVLARVMKGFVKSGCFHLLKSQPSTSEQAEISWLANESNVGFLGCNPDHGLRCVVLSQRDGQPIKVTKIVIGEHLEPVLAEGRFLKEFGGEYPGIPCFGGMEEGDGWAAFHMNHVRGLGPRTMGSGQEIDLLEGWLRPASRVLGEVPWLQPLFAKAPPAIREKLERKVVREALVHGDFTPWNLRRDELGLVAIDWEWAHFDGIGGLDLGHGLIMETLLVNGLSGLQLVDEILLKINRSRQLSYLRECGWDDVNLWLAFALLYSRKLAGLDLEIEMNVLEKKAKQFAAN